MTLDELRRHGFGVAYRMLAASPTPRTATCLTTRFDANAELGRALLERFLDGRVQAVRIVRNPDKLRHVTPGGPVPSDLT